MTDLRLGRLALVMGKDEVASAAVEVDVWAELAQDEGGSTRCASPAGRGLSDGTVDGAIGYESLERFVVTINYDRKLVTLSDPSLYDSLQTDP